MALSKTSLKTKIETELKAQGIVIDGEYAQASKFAIAVANAVVDEINQNALVTVDKGSSAGGYEVQ
ncbi:hypothetical protein [Vibrio cyclitrophicus]|uniref:hypothetical protein n=1 Tax=Vibrio cyclitrophicus TaxID=47951 RepID=UPI0002F6DF64|nr:hypothetical protein [Vibrio cyclitrophicus]OCH56397.1 hypothetical protein A6D96_03980 [Vibrio cyclitrophicus]